MNASLTELAAGEQILSRLSQGSAAINAFNSLLDKSRFQMIILDENLTPLYHNRIADRLFDCMKDAMQADGLKPELMKQIRGLPDSQSTNNLNAMHLLDFIDDNGVHVYVRSIQTQVTGSAHPTLFHRLMALDQDQRSIHLNPDIATQYGLTQKSRVLCCAWCTVTTSNRLRTRRSSHKVPSAPS